MPCFNRENTLEETLESIRTQTLEDFEVLAVDDGSTDGTAAILKMWQQEDPRFCFLPLSHAGIIPALNYGLSAARSDLIARMDADDRMHPDRLEKQAAYLDAHPEVDLVSSFVAGFPADKLRGGFQRYIEWLNSLASHAEICREIFVESPLCHPSVTFRKQVVTGLGGYQEHGWAEDYDLWLRMFLAGCTFAKIEETLLEWREHPHRLTRTDSRYSLENFIRAKAHYLAIGPLAERESVIIWGAGMHGRRLSKHLMRAGVHIRAFVDIDPKKIGRTRRGRPIISRDDLPSHLESTPRPTLLAAVGASGARELIRSQLNELDLVEGRDWWSAA